MGTGTVLDFVMPWNLPVTEVLRPPHRRATGYSLSALEPQVSLNGTERSEVDAVQFRRLS